MSSDCATSGVDCATSGVDCAISGVDCATSGVGERESIFLVLFFLLPRDVLNRLARNTRTHLCVCVYPGMQ